MGENSITPGEFERGIKLVTDTVALGLSGVHSRLGGIEQTQIDQAQQIGEIKSSVPLAAADAARAAVELHITAKRKTWAGWGITAGSVAGGLFEMAHRYLAK